MFFNVVKMIHFDDGAISASELVLNAAKFSWYGTKMVLINLTWKQLIYSRIRESEIWESKVDRLQFENVAGKTRLAATIAFSCDMIILFVS